MSIRDLSSSGVFWALVAAALYTLASAAAKMLVQDFHVLEILFFRQIVVFLSTLPDLRRTFPHSLRTTRPGQHAVRLVGAFLALSCGIWAVAVLPLATAMTLGFSQVFFVALLARMFLGETVGRDKFAAIALGFVGGLVVMRPGTEGLSPLHAAIPLLGGIGGAMAVISVRRLSQTESTATLLLYQSLFVGLLSGVPLFVLWTTPTAPQLGLLFGVGIVATLGQWCGVRALRLAEASVVGTFDYIKLVYAELLGMLAFDERSDRQTMLGAAIIVVAAYAMVRLRARDATALLRQSRPDPEPERQDTAAGKPGAG